MPDNDNQEIKDFDEFVEDTAKDAAKTAEGAARIAADVATGNYVKLAVDTVQTAPHAKRLIASIVVPVALLLVAVFAIPSQVGYAVSSYFSAISAAMEGAWDDITEEYLINQTGVGLYDYTVGAVVDGATSVLSVTWDRISGLWKADDDGTDDETISTDALEGELNIADDMDAVSEALNNRIEAIRNRVNARTSQMQSAMSLDEFLSWATSIVGEYTEVDQSKIIGERLDDIDESQQTVTSTFKDYAAAEIMAAYSIQIATSTYSSSDDYEIDEDGNVTSEGDTLADFLKFVGYQEFDPIRTVFDSEAFPWSGTFMPQSMYEEYQTLLHELDSMESQIETLEAQIETAEANEEDTSDLDSELDEMEAQMDEIEAQIEELENYQTGIINYVITASLPETVYTYRYYDDAGNVVIPEYDEETGEYDYSGIASTAVVKTKAGGICYTSADDLAKIIGFWSGDEDGSVTDDDTGYNSALAEYDEQMINAANSDDTDDAEDADNETEEEVDLVDDVTFAGNGTDEVTEEGDDADDNDGTEDTEDSDDADATDETEDEQVINLNNVLNVGEFFNTDIADYYYSTVFGYHDNDLELMQTALSWGRTEDGTLSLYYDADGNAVEITDTTDTSSYYKRSNFYQYEYFQDMMSYLEDLLGISEEDPGDGTRLVEIAQQELSAAGTVEDVLDDSCLHGSKYQEWAGIGDGAWCCAFVYWCADQLGYVGDGCFGPNQQNCEASWDYFDSQNRTHLANSGYTPSPGDLIYYFNEEEDRISHIGIVESVTGTTVTTIEGNTTYTDNGILNRNTHSLSDSRIYGYASPAYPASSGISLEDADSIQEYFWLYGLSQGYSEYAIAGIMGNIYQECGSSTKDLDQIANIIAAEKDGWNYSKLNVSVIDGFVSTAIGIAQWTDNTKTGITNYTKFCSWCTQNGYSSTDFYAQVEYLFEQLEGHYSELINDLNAASSAANAAKKFEEEYERAGTPNLDVRMVAAEAYYERFHGVTLANSSYSSSSTDLGEQIVEAADAIGQQIISISGMIHKWEEDPTLAQILKDKKVSCASYVSVVLQQVGILDSKESIAHTQTDNKNGSTKTTRTSALKGNTSSISPNEMKIEYVNRKFSELSPQYKVPGCIYVYDSNIAIYAGEGVTFSFRQSEGKPETSYSETSGYNFTQKILVVLVPQ